MLGAHLLEVIAAYVYDKAATLLGKKKLNFNSEQDFEEKFEVAVAVKLLKMQESMSKEQWAQFDQKSLRNNIEIVFLRMM